MPRLAPKKKLELEDLAIMIQRGFLGVDEKFAEVNQRFEQVDKRFEQVDKRFEGLDQRLEHVDARLMRIEQDITEIRNESVRRNEFDDLMARVKYVERKLDIVSGA